MNEFRAQLDQPAVFGPVSEDAAPETVARFQQQNGAPGPKKFASGREASGAATNDNYVGIQEEVFEMSCLFLSKQILTGLRTTAAGFGADPAMFHLRAVLLAFRAATLARFNAGAELGARQFEIGPGKTRDDAAGGETHVRAINAIADATDLFGDVLLAETGVGAGVARLSA